MYRIISLFSEIYTIVGKYIKAIKILAVLQIGHDYYDYDIRRIKNITETYKEFLSRIEQARKDEVETCFDIHISIKIE